MTRKPISTLALANSFAALTLKISTPTEVQAHMIQTPCDFITSGNFVFKDNGAMANFAADGNCKKQNF